MNISDIAIQAHEQSVRSGFHEGEKVGSREQVASFVANIHGEVSELWEAYRAGKLDEPCDKAAKMSAMGLRPLTCLEEEIADIIIRCLDTAVTHGIDIEQAIYVKHAYNGSRPFKHGGKLA